MSRLLWRCGTAVLGCLLTWQTGLAQTLAPGYGELAFQPPAAGSYSLPPLGEAAGGEVLDSRGREVQLADLLGEKIVLLGFIYTHCSDINGCPLASYVMKQVQQRLAGQPQLAGEVRLVSLSFDPILDTPAALEAYAQHFRRAGGDWRFLTTASEQQLAPILERYGQWRQLVYDGQGEYDGSIAHVLRVYLIDRQRRIRNIYSTGFLHPDVVLNDIRTLLLEAPAD